jgi:cation transport protein ChaC
LVYRESLRNVWLDGQERPVEALAYIVDRGHPQYAGRLTLEQRLHYIRQGHGQSGPNRDYVLSTVEALESMGCRDTDLHALAARLRGPHETPLATAAASGV